MKVLVLVLVFCLIVICASQEDISSVESVKVQPRGLLRDSWPNVQGLAEDSLFIAGKLWDMISQWLESRKDKRNRAAASEGQH